ncbi:MAG: peptidase and chymotrypsin/Hap [Schlesneria sp.]|nr:peptidase and chymotrypsin/Hap [Schlesneria sp.]
MRQMSTLVLCGGTLVAGLVLGAGFGSSTFPRTVQADPLDSATTERLYRELSQDTSAFQEGSNLLAKITAVCTPAVVHIQSERKVPGRGREEETGSGVIMNSAKLSGFFVVTNAHVVDKTPMESISIHLHDGRQLQPERVWADPQTDVAILRVSAPNLTAAKWGDSMRLDIGHMVLAMGSPFGLSRSVTFGIISAKGRRQLKLGQSEVLNQDFLQTDAAINPGNSGGPLIDMQGRVVGINTAIASSSGGNEGIGFSIPSHLVQRVMEQLLEHGVVTRAWIGVKLDDKFDSKAATKLKLDRLSGTRVSEVFPNSPAARSGLQFDDVILNFDTTDVQDHDHLINLVSLSPIGKRIQMVVWRGGKKINLFIVLADRSELPANSEAPKSELGVPVRTMGLTVHPLDEDLADQLGHSRAARGLLIMSVDRNGPLSQRLQPYDIIEAIGRTPVSNLDELTEALNANADRDSVVLRIHRGDSAESGLEEQLIVWKRAQQAESSDR